MKKGLKLVLSILLVFTLLLTGCQGGQSNSSENVSLDVATWFEENVDIWRTVENGAWSNDPKDAPTDEELAKILDTACKTQTAVGWTPYYFVAVRDPEEQKAIIGDAWEGATSEGTVTVLILSDQIADQDHHKDTYGDLYMQTPVAYFDTGMASGLLNITAYSLGYGTHYFCSPNGTSINPLDDHVFGFGDYPTPNYDLSRFIGDRGYTRGWGLMNSEYEVEGNVVMIGAVVIGKPDPSMDAKSAATQNARPSNWTIWEADETTSPLE